jgi:hypothetical protein
VHEVRGGGSVSGNWNTKPRKGEKSIETQRSDQENVIRREYRAAGELDGMMRAWNLVADAHGQDFALVLAIVIVRDWPKSGPVELARFGASEAYMALARGRGGA